MSKKVTNSQYSENIRVINKLNRLGLFPEYTSKVFWVEYNNKISSGSGNYAIQANYDSASFDDRSVLIHWDVGEDKIDDFVGGEGTDGLYIKHSSQYYIYKYDGLDGILTITSNENQSSIIRIYLTNNN